MSLEHPTITQPREAPTVSPLSHPQGDIELADEFITVEHSVGEGTRWAFELGLPESVLLVHGGDAVPNLAVPTQTLALFRLPQPEADIEILGHELLFEVDAADWLDAALAESERTIVSRKPLPTQGGMIGDVLTRWVLDGEAFVGRYIALKWGPRLLVCCCRCAEADYAALAGVFLAIGGSLTMMDDSPGVFAEPVYDVECGEPRPWRLSLLDSWEMMPTYPQEDGTWFEAQHRAPIGPGLVGGDIDGRMVFVVMARSAADRPRDAANVVLSSLRDNEISLGHIGFEEEPPPPPPHSDGEPAAFMQSWLLTTAVERQGLAGELRCRVLRHKNAWVVASVLGPARRDDVEAWMRNKRQLDVATATLEILSKKPKAEIDHREVSS
jgi:hypothetical protein